MNKINKSVRKTKYKIYSIIKNHKKITLKKIN